MKEAHRLFIDDGSTRSDDATERNRLVRQGDELVPVQPHDLAETGLSAEVLSDQAIKLANTTYSFTTEWAAERLHLPVQIVEEALRRLANEKNMEILGQVTAFTHRYTLSERGIERARRLLEISGYIGPAPVPLRAYRALIEAQIDAFPRVRPDDVSGALSDLVLEDTAAKVAGLALSSGRSLFLFGPPGNGKTSVGRKLQKALHGTIWIPYSIAVDNDIIRLFDSICHEPAPLPEDESAAYDRRWVRVRRPMIITGGELAFSSLDLAFSPTMRFYEAPLHLKANGGILFIDDLGRQRIEPHELLNRWIVPLEYGIDHLTLRTGQQIPVPFRQFLIVATNLEPKDVTDAAFLRRMGYRLQLDNPTREAFIEIFKRCASKLGLAIPKGMMDRLFERYRAERREFRGSHPQDLLERVVDTCHYEDTKLQLTEENLDLAWKAHFGGLAL
jgi:hypothetical protein